MIIDTYIDKINNPKHTNREELIQKLRKKFIKQYNIDTSAVFSGNRLYSLMFDIISPQSISPTDPTHGTGTQIHVDNIA
jgi:predicted molibdopterin-dependent oxidoreductase YjgC